MLTLALFKSPEARGPNKTCVVIERPEKKWVCKPCLFYIAGPNKCNELSRPTVRNKSKHGVLSYDYGYAKDRLGREIDSGCRGDDNGRSVSGRTPTTSS